MKVAATVNRYFASLSKIFVHCQGNSKTYVGQRLNTIFRMLVPNDFQPFHSDEAVN